jgi:hypothetical protein
VAYRSSTWNDRVLYAAVSYCKASNAAWFCTGEMLSMRNTYQSVTWQTTSGWNSNGVQATALLASLKDSAAATYRDRMVQNTRGWLSAGACQSGCWLDQLAAGLATLPAALCAACAWPLMLQRSCSDRAHGHPPWCAQLTPRTGARARPPRAWLCCPSGAPCATPPAWPAS